jgi:hypothetical protein
MSLIKPLTLSKIPLLLPPYCMTTPIRDASCARKAEAEGQKATDEGDLAVTTKDLAENEAELAKITSGCLQTAADYEEAIRAREEELKVIAEAKKILQETSAGAVSQTYDFVQVTMTTHTDLMRSEIVTAVSRLAKHHHSASLAQLASRIGVVMQYGGSSKGESLTKSRV